MFNPWIILAVVLAFAVSNASSFMYGGHVKEAEVMAQAKMEQDKAIVAANDQAEKDKQLAVANAAKDAQARTTASFLRSQANVAIKPQPAVCDWTQPAYKLLLASVQAANGDQAVGASSLSSEVSKSNRSGK